MHTRSMTTDASRRAVLHTHELLESILDALPMPTLLSVRRVCKTWNNLLLTSPRLLRKLYLAPTREADVEKWIIDKQTHVVRKYHRGDEARFGRAWTDRQGGLVVAELNPLFLRTVAEEREEGKTHAERYDLCETLHLTCRPDLNVLATPAGEKKKKNLALRMFVCQPPCTRFEMHVEYYEEKPKRKDRCAFRVFPAVKKVRVAVENAKGVTMGDVLKGTFVRAKFLDYLGRAS